MIIPDSINIQTVVTVILTIVLFIIGQEIKNYIVKMKEKKEDGVKEGTQNKNIESLNVGLNKVENIVDRNSNRLTEVETTLKTVVPNIYEILKEIREAVNNLNSEFHPFIKEFSELKGQHDYIMTKGGHD